MIQLNAWRSWAGLPPVVEEALWSEGDVLHSRYSVKEDVLEHDERPTSPWFTAAGRAAAMASNGSGNGAVNAPDSYAIESWVQAPFHAIGMFDPYLRRVGYESYREADGGMQMSGWLDVIRGVARGGTAPRFPLTFPANGAVIPIPNREICPAGTACFWGEYPDPVTSCPGYTRPAGLPLIMQLGPPSLSPGPVVTASALSRGGSSLEHCVFTGATYVNSDPAAQATGRSILTSRGGIVLVPRQPLPSGQTYVAALTVDGRTYEWSFRIAETPAAAAGHAPRPEWALKAVPPSFRLPAAR